jgi:GT2 family glycosyltransferase
MTDVDAASLPQIAIVVLNYGTTNLTDDLAFYLIHHLNYPNKKVYVVDNGSPAPPGLTTHALAENLGFTRGMYEAYCVASAEDDYDAYWFLNSDVGFEYGNHVLLHLVDVLFASDSYAQISPQHNSPHSFMEDAYAEAQAVPYLEATATLIKASTIRSLGFWDLDLTYGWGVDYDYGYRVRKAGLLNILTNRARITHKEHQSIADLPDYINKASAEMNHILRAKYGEDWIRITYIERNIVPLILSCDRDLDLANQFVSSYKTVQAGLARPIVIIDISSSTRLSAEYMSLIAQLNPRSVHIHPRERDMGIYDSVQEAVDFGFKRAIEETVASDLVLFIEDDIVFSSRFLQELLSMHIKSDTGFISLYTPGHEYGGREIDPEKFYGTQCVLFPRRSIQEIAENWIEIKTRIPPGYDIRWSRFLGERGYKLYCTGRSYVQHLQSTSRLHNDSSHVSNSFVG